MAGHRGRSWGYGLQGGRNQEGFDGHASENNSLSDKLFSISFMSWSLLSVGHKTSGHANGFGLPGNKKSTGLVANKIIGT